MLAVLVHPDGRRVAALDGALPQAELDTDTFSGAGVSAAFAARLGTPLALVRRLHFRRLSDGPDGLRVRAAVWQLDPLGDVQGVTWPLPEALPESQRAWVEAALAPAPPSRPPWQRPGWFAATLAWLDARLSALGRPRTGEPVILRHGQISALWHVPTESGPLYLKAVPPFFARELTVTAWLNRALPGAGPPVLALDELGGLLLMDHAGAELYGRADLDGPALARRLAGVQRATEGRLEALDLPDHGPAWVARELPGLLCDKHFQLGQPEGLTPDEARAMLALRPRLEASARRLAESPIPVTLGHGDLHLGNVAVEGERLTLLDWSDASLTHPFLDAAPAYLVSEETGQAGQDAFRDAYLEAWSELAPLPELRALYADAALIAEVYRALGYTLGIQPQVEDQSEWGSAHLYHLRALLERAQA